MPMPNDSQVSTTTVRTRSLPSAPAGIVHVILLPFTHRPSNNFDPRFSVTASGTGFGVVHSRSHSLWYRTHRLAQLPAQFSDAPG